VLSFGFGLTPPHAPSCLASSSSSPDGRLLLALIRKSFGFPIVGDPVARTRIVAVGEGPNDQWRSHESRRPEKISNGTPALRAGWFDGTHTPLPIDSDRTEKRHSAFHVAYAAGSWKQDGCCGAGKSSKRPIRTRHALPICPPLSVICCSRARTGPQQRALRGADDRGKALIGCQRKASIFGR
jgi:hypothetical protein